MLASFTRILVRQSTGLLVCCAVGLFYLLVLKVLGFNLLFSLLLEKMWKLVETDCPAFFYPLSALSHCLF